MAIGMATTIVYLTISSSQWRLASLTHDNDKAANSKAIMAVECAAELLNWLKGLRASTKALDRLHIGG